MNADLKSSLWPELLSSALVGTARRPLGVRALPAPLDSLISEAELAADGGLLAAAGALTLARRAGAVAVTGIDAPQPADIESRPLVSDAAAARLGHLLDDQGELDNLTLWLSLAAERDLRVPPRHLPALFRQARFAPELRPQVVTVGGVRGAWLAAQRADWRWVFDAHTSAQLVDDERVWLEGAPAERVAFLATLRGHDPRRARELLVEAWPETPTAERASLLAVLADCLSAADEEFCETALDDRRKEVRAAAVALLADLDGSAYQGRMAARAVACVSPVDKRRLMLVTRRLTVSPPVECDAAMKRDGVDPQPPGGTGERAWWCEQVIMQAPLSAWAPLAATPAAILALPVEDGWAPTLQRAWARAAVRGRAVDWAVALIGAGFGRGSGVEVHDASLAASLYELLPAEAAVALALRTLRTSGVDIVHVTRLLAACPKPWPGALSTALLGFLRDQALASRVTYLPPRLRELSHAIVAGLALDTSTEVIALATSIRAAHQDPRLSTLMDDLVQTVSVRYQMFQEFA